MIKKLFKLIRRTLNGQTRNRPVISPKVIEPASVAASIPADEKNQTGRKQDAIAADNLVTEDEGGSEQPKKSGKYRKTAPAKKTQQKKVWDLTQFEVVPEEGKSRFHDFNLPIELMHAIADLEFRYCTPIQAQTLEHTMSGTDAIGQAQTGTGKTAAFWVTILCTLLRNQPKGKRKKGCPRALIIAPTRELVMQISKDGESLAKYCPQVINAVFGGMDYDKQQQALEQRPVDILVATPGRLIDFQRRRIVDLSHVEIMVIDEADRMLDMGFIPDVRRIVNSTPPREKRQTLMFSATMTPDVKRLASQWCKNPINVEIAPENVAVDTVNQIVYLATADEKYAILYNMVTSQNLKKVLVFTNRRDETRRLFERLTRNNISCDMLSGDVAQKKRMSTLERFRNDKISVLVATDVAGRGIHIDGISHVFNYVLPYEPEDYVHRIGRTGRAGHSGIAISFADEEAAFYLPEIEKYIGRKLECVYPDEELIKPAPKGTAPKGGTPKKPYNKSSQSKRYSGGRRRPSSPGRNSRPRQSKPAGRPAK